MNAVIKTMLKVIIVSGLLSACSSETQGTDSYFDEPEDEATPYIYPHPLDSPSSYRNDKK